MLSLASEAASLIVDCPVRIRLSIVRRTFPFSTLTQFFADGTDQLRFAAPASLPVSFPDHIIGPAGRTASSSWAEVDTDPLTLLERAWEQLELLPDDPANVRLLEATFAVADALATVRGHYE